jgi:hypothetical protein
LRHRDQRPDWSHDRRQRRRLKRHLDADMRAQPLPRSEFRAIGQIGGEEAAFVGLSPPLSIYDIHGRFSIVFQVDS